MFTPEKSKTESIFTTYPTQSYTLHTEVRTHVKRFDFPGGGSMLNRMRAGPEGGRTEVADGYQQVKTRIGSRK